MRGKYLMNDANIHIIFLLVIQYKYIFVKTNKVFTSDNLYNLYVYKYLW